MKLQSLGILLVAGMFAFVSGCGDDGDGKGGGAKPTATSPPAPTNTAPAAATDTPEAGATETATPPEEETPTPTGTPEEPAEALGERIFSIAPPSPMGTGLFPSLLGGANAASAAAGGPLALVAGTVAAETGIAPLSLKEDVIVGLTQPVGVICTKYLAEGSEGSIDCDGGSPYDVVVTQETGETAPPATVESGQGDDAGPGAATLVVMQQTVQAAVGTDCDTVDYTDAPVETSYYTTANAMATKGAATITLAGENFDCAEWTTTDGAGILASPATTFNTLAGGDTANITKLDD